MAIQTGSSTGVLDLLGKIAVFAAANGILVNRYAEQFTIPGGVATGNYNLNLEWNGKFYNFYGQPLLEKINMSLSPAFGSFNFGLQVNDSNVAANVQIDVIPGPYPTYWFIKDSYSFHIVVESSTGVYKHFSFGHLIKAGSYVGGEYICGFSWNTTPGLISAPRHPIHSILFSDVSASGTSARGGVVRADHTGASPNWAIIGNLGNAVNSCKGDIWGNVNAKPLSDSPNAINQVIPLLTVGVYVNDGTGTWFPVGEVSNLRACDIQNINPEEVILTDWKVFPIVAKNGSAGNYNSGTYGVAYNMSV